MTRKIGHELVFNKTAFIQLTLCYFGSRCRRWGTRHVRGVSAEKFTFTTQTLLVGVWLPARKSFFSFRSMDLFYHKGSSLITPNRAKPHWSRSKNRSSAPFGSVAALISHQTPSDYICAAAYHPQIVLFILFGFNPSQTNGLSSVSLSAATDLGDD